MSEALELVVKALETTMADPKVSEGWNGQWSSRCPAHEDDSPSLSFREGSPVAIRCHAGCEATEVLEAIGLTWADLYGAVEASKPAPQESSMTARKRRPNYARRRP